jgi:hypothetical protein
MVKSNLTMDLCTEDVMLLRTLNRSQREAPPPERATMVSLMQIYQQVCTHEPPLIATSSHKDVLTALKYLAKTYGTTPDVLAFTPAVEADYRQRLHTYFAAHPKGHSTVRNTLNYLSKLWKVFHTLDRTPPIHSPAPMVPGVKAARTQLRAQSPYRHARWLRQHPYDLPRQQWPAAVAHRWEAYLQTRTHDVRGSSATAYTKRFALYVGYQLLSPADRLSRLPDIAQAKLKTKAYASPLREITEQPILTSWEEIFDPVRLNSYITWSSWRCWRWHDEALKEKPPHRPSTTAWNAAVTIEQLAKRTGHPRHAELNRLLNALPKPVSMHDKRHPRHRFELSEFETVALALMDEARRMCIDPRARGFGGRRAARFQLGLILQLLWRNPMRARNWCEAILGLNLTQVDGQWRWRFEGTELKVGMRGPDPNVFEPDVPPEVSGHLDEFLSHYRPHFKHAAQDRHVFLSMGGRPLTISGLANQLKWHVNRFTGRYLYTHLVRSLFSTHHLSHGVDINTVAYAMNDTPASVLKAYNQLHAETHRPIIAAANRRALAQGDKLLTPPVIPTAPNAPRPRSIASEQRTLL